MAILDGRDDFLLAWPNPEPHVKGHDSAEHRPGVDQVGAISEVSPSSHQAKHNPDEDETDSSEHLDVLSQRGLCQHVIEKHSKKGDRHHHDCSQTPALVRIIQKNSLVIVEDDTEEQHSCGPGPGCTPAKPEERAWH